MKEECDEPKAILLDLAEDSLRDQYKDCTAEMSKKVYNNYLKSELNTEPFKSTWNEATKLCKNKGLFGSDNLEKEHVIAIYAYTMGGVKGQKKLNRVFNYQTKTGGRDYETFPFKSLHFFLTEAVRILKGKNEKKCRTVFRGTICEFEVQENTPVRFGQFTSTSLNKDIAKTFGTGTLFEIETCDGAYINKYSHFIGQNQEEVLIPPYETFKVVSKEGNVIQLKHMDYANDQNCLALKNIPSTSNASARKMNTNKAANGGTKKSG